MNDDRSIVEGYDRFFRENKLVGSYQTYYEEFKFLTVAMC